MCLLMWFRSLKLWCRFARTAESSWRRLPEVNICILLYWAVQAGSSCLSCPELDCEQFSWSWWWSAICFWRSLPEGKQYCDRYTHIIYFWYFRYYMWGITLSKNVAKPYKNEKYHHSYIPVCLFQCSFFTRTRRITLIFCRILWCEADISGWCSTISPYIWCYTRIW